MHFMIKVCMKYIYSMSYMTFNIKSVSLCVPWAKYHSHVLLDSGAVRPQCLLFMTL